jgi:hypothetical protein
LYPNLKVGNKTVANPYESPNDADAVKAEKKKVCDRPEIRIASEHKPISTEVVGAVTGFSIAVLLGVLYIAWFRSTLPTIKPGQAQDGTGGLPGLLLMFVGSPIAALIGWLIARERSNMN